MKYLFYLLVLFSAFSLTAQADCLAGQIVDDEGYPLIGASILIKGTTTGTVSDIDGKFSICGLTAGEKVEIVISYTGFRTQGKDVVVGDPFAAIQIEPDAAVLEEVVVIGYGVQRKQSMSVSSASVSSAPAARKDRARGKRRRNSKISATHRPEPGNSESYNKIKPNTFVKTKVENISTISTDVDRAAYANIRRFLNNGELPPADAVRSEEMINYFNYEDPNPETKNDIALRTEFMTCPWNPQNQLLRVSAKTMPIATADIPASNLVFLLDVSGSMNSSNKLPLVKESLKMLTKSLRQEDKVSIVVYAGAAGLVLPATSDPATIIAALDKLSSGGSTAGGAGIELAYKTAAENFIQGGNNRIILATDGDFNVGISDQGALVKLIEEKRETGIYLTVLGFGSGNYQEGTMQLLADKGNGNHGYIDSPAEARKILVEEFGGTLYTVAKDVKLQLEFNEQAIASYRLIGYENRLLNTEDFDDDTKDAAEMGAGHNVTVLYELVPARGFNKAETMADLRLRFKPNTGGASKKITLPIAAEYMAENMTSNDLRWSAAVAEFAMLLRRSKHKEEANWAHCLEMAKNAQGADAKGYRAEMIGLIETAQRISLKAKR
jgi:Ca-activated chloride channel family protein